MARHHCIAAVETNKFSTATQMVLASAKEPGFWAEGLDITAAPVIDSYIRDWWPEFYRETCQLAKDLAAGHGDEQLARWIASNEDKLAALAFLDDAISPEPLARTEGRQVQHWIQCALLSYKTPTDARIEAFVIQWAPTMLREAHSQIRELDRLIDELLASQCTTSAEESVPH